jgi:muramoyltetrapeptide carboxypeptidase
MLRQLMLSGALGQVAGIAFGQFTEVTEPGAATVSEHRDLRRPLDDVLREAADVAGVPAIAGIPMGHVDDQWTFPLGAHAELDADACTLRVTLR